VALCLITVWYLVRLSGNPLRSALRTGLAGRAADDAS
jgi:hypothetical protein